MEENNTEYIETEPGTEGIPSDGYMEDVTQESTDSGTDMEESTGTDAEEGIEESGDDGNDTSDSTDSNTDDGTLSDTGTDTAVSAGTPSDDTGNALDVTDGDLLESLDALIKALSPAEDAETGETDGTGTDESTSGPEISEHDAQTLETLQGIQSTLAAIQAENELWHTETLKYREEARETQESIIVHLEYASLLLIAIGFFVALSCGGRFADIFFKRMKGDGRNE